MDSRIFDIGEIEMLQGRIVEGDPYLIFTFRTNHLDMSYDK